jgi:hypothetical protein
MDPEKYLRFEKLLIQSMGGEERFKAAITDITTTLRRHNLDMMPELASDMFCHTMETIHLKTFSLPKT